MDNNVKRSFLVADDHKIITQSLTFILKDLYPNAEVKQINKIGEIIKQSNEVTYELLILDISFPDGNTLQLIPTLKNLLPDCKILIFSGYDEEIYAIRYINAGANGYISKMSSEDEIKEAIISVVNTGKFISNKVQEKITDSYMGKKAINPLEELSNRELEIAQLMVDGFGNTQISTTLKLQKSTVSTYKNRIFEKLHIDNISDLISVFNLNK